MRSYLLCACLGAFFLMGFGPRSARAFEIASGGAPAAVIVVSPDASPAVRHAASELSEYLGEVTGAAFELAHEARPERAEILVGRGAARDADPGFSLAGVGPEGMVLRLSGGDLVLAGTGPRGTLYAVYSFLEDEVGCRWWTSTVSSVPWRPELAVSALDVQYTPPLVYRESFWYDAFDGDWAVRNKCNGNGFRLDAAHGGKISYAGFVHTAYQLIPPGKYFAGHPDWFGWREGQRSAEDGQLCLTNAGMRAELVANLKALLRANPAAQIASVSQNDNKHPCECADCQAVDAAEGSPAGTMLRFVNAVAASIEEEFPTVIVSTLAYQYTRHPPRLTTPRGNVAVRLCSIECSFAEPLTAPVNQSFRDDVVGWSRIADRLYVWDYVTNFRHYLLPHPNLSVLGPNIRFFAAHHVQGVMEQGAYTSAGTEMAPLRAWVVAKLLWNPTLEADELIAEFLRGYFGAASGPIGAYLAELQAAATATGDWVGFYDRAEKRRAFSLPLLRSALAHFGRAREAVAGRPELLARVKTAELPVLYGSLVRWQELRAEWEADGGPWPLSDDVRRVYRRFMAGAAAAGVTRLGESKSLDDLQSRIAEY